MDQLLTPGLCFLGYGICFNAARYSAMTNVHSSGVADNLLFFVVLVAKITGLAFIAYGVWRFGWIGLLLALAPVASAVVYGLITKTLVTQVFVRKLSALGLLVFGMMMFLAAKSASIAA